MDISDINPNDTIEFETVLGERRVNYKYTGSVPWDIARTLGLDVVSKHRQYAIEMPEGSPGDYRDYQYAIFKSPIGEIDLYGVPWIKADTVILKDTVSYNMSIPSANEVQLAALRSMASAIGLKGFKIEPI